MNMTGREKIEAAFSLYGTPQIPAVICYERIFIRDHWPQLTSSPWWYWGSPDIKQELRWRTDVIDKIGQDWFRLPPCPSREDQNNLYREERSEGVFEVDKRTGKEKKLESFTVGKWAGSTANKSIHPDQLPQNTDEIDVQLPISEHFDPSDVIKQGRNDLAASLLCQYERELYPFEHVVSPLWMCYSLWGFEGLMIMIASCPDLVKYACQRTLISEQRKVEEAALMGAAGIWIEECMTDMISPMAFKELNLPYVQTLVDTIRSVGMKSIYYYSGNPAGKLDMILEAGADALSLEESKKYFSIDIEEVIQAVNGRCTVLGNLDAIEVLQNGTERQLRNEIARQINAGRKNKNRFIMSLGSPVTPSTTLNRVQLYCDIVRDSSIR